METSFHFFVELEGVEPSSKQGTNKPSTCLSSYWFSYKDRELAPNSLSYLLYFILPAKQRQNYPKIASGT